MWRGVIRGGAAATSTGPAKTAPEWPVGTAWGQGAREAAGRGRAGRPSSSHPLGMMQNMDQTAHATGSRSALAVLPNPADLAAWLDEVSAEVSADTVSQIGSSPTSQVWAAHQAGFAAEALEALELMLESAAAADDDAAVEELEWLHTRICAVSERLTRPTGGLRAAA
jgi:hypothetical protein